MPPQTDTSPEESSQGQQQQDTQSWEERFKGQQREYNKQQRSLEAAQAALQTAQAERDSIKTSNRDALSAAQQTIADLQNGVKAKETELGDFKTKFESASGELVKYKHRAEVHKKLADLQANDVLPFFDAGDLQIESLDDAAITERITGFRDRLAKLTGKTPDNTPPDRSGASVPGVSAGGAPAGTPASIETLFDWLNVPANLKSSDYPANQTRYLELLSKKK